MILSVIVPVYNVENYLENCINSILNQSFKDFELILINDGSTDNSLSICKEFELYDSRVKVIDKVNEGVSTARNIGIYQAVGEWICFVDSDDEVGKNYLKDLISSIRDCDDCEAVIQGININDFYSKQNKNIAPRYDRKEYILLSENDFLEDIPILCLASPISKLFKKSIIDQFSLKFDSRISIGEDYVFTIQYLSSISKVITSSISNYTYYRREGSLSTTYNSFEEEVLAEQILFKTTMSFLKKNNSARKRNDFYIIEFKKHAYRILFSLYKNREKEYVRKERLNAFKKINDLQLKRLKTMFRMNGFSGKLIALLFSKYIFHISDPVLKTLLNKKLQ